MFPKILHIFARLDLGYLVLHLNKMIEIVLYGGLQWDLMGYVGATSWGQVVPVCDNSVNRY